MFDKILCAVETGNEGRAVLTKALELANKFGSKVYVISVIPHTFLPKDYQAKLEDDIAPELEAMAKEFGISKKRLFVKVGKPYRLICEKAEKIEADLILLGTHSEKGLKGMIGSTANGVANYAPCDVYLVSI
jgi:universal stress protein A